LFFSLSCSTQYIIGITPFLDPVTKDKIRFNPPVLSDLIPSEQLDSQFGGQWNYRFDFDTYWNTLTVSNKDLSNSEKGSTDLPSHPTPPYFFLSLRISVESPKMVLEPMNLIPKRKAPHQQQQQI